MPLNFSPSKAKSLWLPVPPPASVEASRFALPRWALSSPSSTSTRRKASQPSPKSEQGRPQFLKCDVRSAADCHRAVEAVIAKQSKIDILVNCAGIAIRKDVVELTEAEWDLALDVTLKGIYLLSHEVVPHMIRTGGGSIINIGSGWSLKGGPRAAAYCAAKGGAVNLTRAMAIDHGKHNIRVNCVCPGDVDTPMLQSECAQLGENKEAFMHEAANRPLARIGTPDDIANAVLFLASPMSSWITGASLVVDGGGLA